MGEVVVSHVLLSQRVRLGRGGEDAPTRGGPSQVEAVDMGGVSLMPTAFFRVLEEDAGG